MKKQSYLPIVIVLALSALTLLISSCKKDRNTNPDDPNPSGTAHLGWLGDENADEIPNDVLYIGGGNLPDKVDLSSKLPPVGDQGDFGTCVAWATGYYQRTALQAIRYNLNNADLTSTARQFSPKDLYLSIPTNLKGDNCSGTQFESAYDQLIGRGIATVATAPIQGFGDCSEAPSAASTNEAGDYRIDSYRDLPLTVEAFKAKLAEDRPLVFAAWATQAFVNWTGTNVMTAGDVMNSNVLGGHAMTIVGYDDAKQAFRIVNSWGTTWGDNGFAWIDYNLMINPQFIKYAFVAYDKPVDPNGPVTPPPANSTNVAVSNLADYDDTNSDDSRDRVIDFNVANLGANPVPASSDWDVVYLYVNAYDANDYGIILHAYISDDYGNPGEADFYVNGLGQSYSEWHHNDLQPGQLLSQSFWGDDYTDIYWPYYMPELNGSYYLVMIADPFEKLNEDNKSDNLFFITAQDGGPLWFQNGISNGFHTGGAHERSLAGNFRTPVNDTHPNAYRPEEIKTFLQHMKAEGKLAKALSGPKTMPAAGIKQ